LSPSGGAGGRRGSDEDAQQRDEAAATTAEEREAWSGQRGAAEGRSRRKMGDGRGVVETRRLGVYGQLIASTASSPALVSFGCRGRRGVPDQGYELELGTELEPLAVGTNVRSSRPGS
jgi:hypothetical protein